MDILMIAPQQIPVPPKAGGSVEHCIYQIARHFPEGHRIAIASRRPQKRRAGKTNADHAPDSPGPLRFIRIPRSGSCSYISAVLRQVRRKTFDLIQVDNRPAYIPKIKETFPHIPIALFLHSLTYATPASEQLARHLSKADLIIVNSHSLREELTRLYPNLHPSIHAVHLGVDLDQFHPPSRRQRTMLLIKNRLSPAQFTIVYAGRIIPRKGIPTLIHAVHLARESIPSIQLVIAGKPGHASYLTYLKNLAVSLNVPIRFIGQVSHQYMHQVYWFADCFVCPSQQYEAFGLVVAEAAASGTPVVASRNGGIAEIVEHRKEGLLVDDYTNPQAFALQIVRLASDPYLRKQLARQSRLKMEQDFSWRHTASQLKSIYIDYAGRRGEKGNAHIEQVGKNQRDFDQ